MKFILMPFIAIYHVVSAVMSVPGKLLQKIEDKAKEEAEEAEEKDENDEAEESEAEDEELEEDEE